MMTYRRAAADSIRAFRSLGILEIKFTNLTQQMSLMYYVLGNYFSSLSIFLQYPVVTMAHKYCGFIMKSTISRIMESSRIQKRMNFISGYVPYPRLYVQQNVQ
jgi:hypothetical protein